jgi:hypothetical protein
MQKFIIVILLIVALSYIGYRIYKTIAKKKCGEDNCGCK